MRLLIALLVFALLCGCSASYETIADDHLIPEMSNAGEVSVLLPSQASVLTMNGEEKSKLWILDDYIVCTDVYPGGDMNATVKKLTGFEKADIEILTSQLNEMVRHECVWTSAGEEGQLMNRAVIMDDGCYHYTVLLQAPAEKAAQLTESWNQIMASVCISIAQ